MIAGLVIQRNLQTILILLSYRSHNRRRAIFVEVDPWLLRLLIPLSLLNPVKIDINFAEWLDCDGVFVLVLPETFIIEQNINRSNRNGISRLILTRIHAHLVLAAAHMMLKKIKITLIPLGATNINFLAPKLNFCVIESVAFRRGSGLRNFVVEVARIVLHVYEA